MSDQQQPEGDDFIVITHDEAMSSHADDLLNRQKSLRGEAGITAVQGGAWYYQNWFVFLVSGAVAAFLAWAILEPYFNDMHYLQGPIEEITTPGAASERVGPADELLGAEMPITGVLKLAGANVWLYEYTKTFHADGSTSPLEVGDLRQGQIVAVYVEALPVAAGDQCLARFVMAPPPQDAPACAGLSLDEQEARSTGAGLLLFGVVAGLIGLGIGAVDGLVCRLPRRAFLGGAVGLLIGFIGGFVSGILAGVVYTPLNAWALSHVGPDLEDFGVFPFLIQTIGRALAWGLAGTTAGLGHGIALRSKRLVLYGFLGGIIGGLLGGLFFDPIDILLLGVEKPSAHVSRLIGLVFIGASVGAMIGVVELMSRDAWLRMTAGPLVGKEFLLFKDVMRVGASPRSDIYLFKDAEVADHHATLRMTGNVCEIENVSEGRPVELNDRPVQRSRLRHGDVITIGRTSFVFQKRGR